MNETINLLLSKDTKLVLTSKPKTEELKTQDAVDAKDKVTESVQAEPVSVSEVKIGEIKLRGKIQLPARKVILDSSAVSDLRRSLALFSC